MCGACLALFGFFFSFLFFSTSSRAHDRLSGVSRVDVVSILGTLNEDKATDIWRAASAPQAAVKGWSLNYTYHTMAMFIIILNWILGTFSNFVSCQRGVRIQRPSWHICFDTTSNYILDHSSFLLHLLAASTSSTGNVHRKSSLW